MVFLQFLKILILSKEIYNYELVPEKYKLKNGKLITKKQEYDFRNYDYFDDQNTDHLHAVLDNHPLRSGFSVINYYS